MSKGPARMCTRGLLWPCRVRKDRPTSKEGTTYMVMVNGVLFHLTAERGVGTWVSARGVGADREHYPNPCPLHWRGLYVVKKRQVAPQTAAKHIAAMESAVFSKLHPIVAHCCATQYDDGEARKPGWLTVKTMGSAWVCEVKDPDSCCRLCVVQQTLDDALALLSVLLESDDAPWEPDPWLAQQRAKEAKKK